MSTVRPTIAIAGFGLEGKATYAHFAGKAEIHIFDETPIDPEGLDATIHQGLSIPAYIDTVYKTPGIPSSKLQLESETTKVTTLMDLILESVSTQAIGITGTKGKSTVASLIAHILKESGRDTVILGNIGIVDTDIINNKKEGRIYVFELSSYQCEYVTHSPHVAVLTNLYSEHLSHHGTFNRYREAKLNIARFQSAADIFIKGTEVSDTFNGSVVHPVLEKPFATQLKGAHNQWNCALALEAVKAFGVSEDEARAAIEIFAPLAFRLENIGTFDDITFYDDALATIPEATLASIEALGTVDTILLGGEDRGIPFDTFAQALSKTTIQTFIVFPDTGAKMVTQVSDRTVISVSSMQEAVAAAYAHTAPGGTVLLSNASPSFNLFKDYRDKSSQYRSWVSTLAPTH